MIAANLPTGTNATAPILSTVVGTIDLWPHEADRYLTATNMPPAVALVSEQGWGWGDNPFRLTAEERERLEEQVSRRDALAGRAPLRVQWYRPRRVARADRGTG